MSANRALCWGFLACTTMCACTERPSPPAPETGQGEAIGEAIKAPADQAAKASTPPARSPTMQGLEAYATEVLDAITAQEAARDATCWTTVRMMDNFSAGLTFDHPASVLKIEAHKALVHSLWQQASVHAGARGADQVDLTDLQRAMPAPLKEAPEGDEARDAIQHRKITEAWRVQLSLLSEALAGRGAFEGRQAILLPLAPEARETMNEAAVRLSLRLIDAAEAAARAARHRRVAVSDVQTAYDTIRARLELPLRPGASTPRGAIESSRLRALQRLTTTNINHKVQALAKWNEGKGPADPREAMQRDLDLINRFGPGEFTPDGLRTLFEQMLGLPRLVAAGADAMRLDAMLDSTDLFMHQPPKRHISEPIDLARVMNITEQIFPHRTLTNGDVAVDVAFTVRDQRFEHRFNLLHSDLDAVRDTGIHWRVMEIAWLEQPGAPLDPFAAELLSERISERFLFYATLYHQVAEKAGVARIDGAFLRSGEVSNVLFTTRSPAVRPTELSEVEAWGPEQLQARSKALARYTDQPRFADVTAQSGLPTTAALTAPPDMSRGFVMHERMGAGVGVGDFDDDGRVDLLLAGDAGNQVLRNLGNRRFKPISSELFEDGGPAALKPDDARHPLFVDVDNDGRLDVFLVRSGSPSKLWLQTAEGRFAAARTVPTGPGAHAATFLDYNQDGLLDVYVAHYASRTREGHEYPTLDGRNGRPNRLLKNLGKGRFVEATEEAGLSSTGWTLATLPFDADQDGDLDLYLANDFGADQLFTNDGQGRFVDASDRLGVDDRGSGMNASVTDINGDGRWDLYVSTIDTFSKNVTFRFPAISDHIPLDQRILKSTLYISGNKLLQGSKAGFTPVEADHIEPGQNGWSWGALFFDYENDGDEDLYLTNGWAEGFPAHNEANQFLIQADGRLYRTPSNSPERDKGNARGAAFADLTGTGQMDLVINQFRSPPRLLANQAPQPGHWLKVRLKGVKSNHFGVGATVRAIWQTDETERSAQRLVSCGSHYLAQSNTTVTFGVGEAESVKALEVRWPDGRLQRVPGPHQVGQTLTVVERTSR